MGVWLGAKGRLEVVPQPDNQLLVDFWNCVKDGTVHGG